MRALEPCLAGLPETSRKVLSLRAGLGTARSRSRRDVAGITGFSLRRVGRVEAGALRRLKRLARTTGCAAAVTTDAFAVAMGGAAGGAGLAGPGLTGAGLTRSSFLSQDGSAARAPGIGVLSERESSAGDSDTAGGSGLGLGLPGVSPGPGGDVPVAVLIAIALGGVALTVLLYRRSRRRDRWDPSEPW